MLGRFLTRLANQHEARASAVATRRKRLALHTRHFVSTLCALVDARFGDDLTRCVRHDSLSSHLLEEWDVGRLSVNIELIKRGVRTAAHITIRRDAIGDVTKAIRGAGLLMNVEPCGEHHIDIVMFSHPHLALIIPKLGSLPEPLRDWAYGKLFGYSEDAIGAFLATAETKPSPGHPDQ